MAAMASIFFMQGCQKEEELSYTSDSDYSKAGNLTSNKDMTTYGPAVAIGQGTATSWITYHADGSPASVGITLSELALVNLPAENRKYILALPVNGETNFYDHVLLSWDPVGHEPKGYFDKPHFDTYFYIISNKERLEIGTGDQVVSAESPDPEFVPPMFMKLTAVETAVGVQWMDLMAPALNGGLYSKSFLWGSVNGKFVFWQTMVTRDFLLTRPDVITPIRQPAAFQRPGWYAKDYRVSYSADLGEYTIALMNLAYRQGE